MWSQMDRFGLGSGNEFEHDFEKQLALRQEVEEGKSNVGMVDSEPMRTTFVIVLLIHEGASQAECIESQPAWGGLTSPNKALSRAFTRTFGRSNSAFDARRSNGKSGRKSFGMMRRFSFDGNPNPRVLVRVGVKKHGSSQVKPCCVLPGGKRKENETRHACLQRVMQTDLKDIMESLVPDNRIGERSVEVKYSANFGIKTRYLKTTYAFHVGHRRHHLQIINMQPLPSGSSARCCRSCWASGKRRAAERARLALNGIDSVFVLGNALYVWLRNAEFEVLSNDHVLEVIAKWLEQIPIDEYDLGSNGEEEETYAEGACAALDSTLDTPPPLPEAVCAAEPPPESSRPATVTLG